jgi:hypothetical protein
MLGMLGVGSGFLASLAAVGFSPELLIQFAMVAAMGGTVGSVIGRRITATELPQMVAGTTSHYANDLQLISRYSSSLRCWSRGSPYIHWQRFSRY